MITRFTDQRNPKPRSRELISFHRPETLREWISQVKSLRTRLLDFPSLDTTGLRDCQIGAITNLEASFQKAKPRALVQMATGSGKTITAITSIYRLLKHAKVKRVLFLVDTRNLGEQAEQEFIAYTPTDDNRSFTSLFATQRLSSSHVPADAQVCISTIQRMYSILQGREMTDDEDDTNPAETATGRKEPPPVAYNEKVPPEFFDVIVIDECHRSIYNLWRQVLDYFDAFLVGLTAAIQPLTGVLVTHIVETCKKNLQLIDHHTIDVLLGAGWDTSATDAPKNQQDFESFLSDHKDQLIALTIFYDQPQRRQELTFSQISKCSIYSKPAPHTSPRSTSGMPTPVSMVGPPPPRPSASLPHSSPSYVAPAALMQNDTLLRYRPPQLPRLNSPQKRRPTLHEQPIRLPRNDPRPHHHLPPPRTR